MASAESPKWRWEPSGPYWPKANVLLPHRLDVCTKEPAYNVRVRMSPALVCHKRYQAIMAWFGQPRNWSSCVQIWPIKSLAADWRSTIRTPRSGRPSPHHQWLDTAQVFARYAQVFLSIL